MNRALVAVAVVFVFVTLHVPPSAAERIRDDPWQVLHTTDGTFEEVRENVELAITGQGLVINHVSRVGQMLDATAEDLGFDERLYLHADVLEFCSAVLSRRMMAADPANVAFCPFTIQVYELPDRPGTIYVGYRRPPMTGSDEARAALKEIDELLTKIVADALSW
jgi:uncharacterized protein (DUF302 family)